MMDCKKFEEYIDDYFTDPDLDWKIREEIDDHYFSCKKCFETYQIAKLMADEGLKKETIKELQKLESESSIRDIYDEALNSISEEKPTSRRIEDVLKKLKGLADFSPEFRDKVASIIQKVKMHQDGFSKLSPGLQASFFRDISGLDERELERRDMERMVEELERIVSDMEKEIDKP